jgi:hypothetical protein
MVFCLGAELVLVIDVLDTRGGSLTGSAGGIENILAPQPLLKDQPIWREDVKQVLRIHADRGPELIYPNNKLGQ